MSGEKIGLIRKDFNVHAGNYFTELFENHTFSDVTLVSEDHQQIKAHKTVLNTASPFFKDIFGGNIHPHPLIYLQVKYSYLEALVRFIYLGECEVLQKDLNQFLFTANKLRVEGLNSEEGGWGVKGEELEAQEDTENIQHGEQDSLLTVEFIEPDEGTNISKDNFKSKQDKIHTIKGHLQESDMLSEIGVFQHKKTFLEPQNKNKRLKQSNRQGLETPTEYINHDNDDVIYNEAFTETEEGKIIIENQFNSKNHTIEVTLPKSDLPIEPKTSLHKKKFLELLQENRRLKGFNQKGFKTPTEYMETLQRIFDIKTGKVKPGQQDYNNMKRFDVRDFEVDGKQISRLVKLGTDLKVLSDEEIFEVLNELHLSSGHSGRDSLRKFVKDNYSNITIDPIRIFLRSCEFCQTKQGRNKLNGDQCN